MQIRNKPRNFTFGWKFTALFFACFLAAIAQPAYADFEALPESRALLFRTYALFIDQQSMLLMKDGGRAWGALGGSVALVGNPDWLCKPQLVIHGSANAAFQTNDRGDTLLTQTIDARAGLALDFEFTDTFRGAIIWTHESGHVADNVPDFDLFGSNLGNEKIDFRVVKDVDGQFRLGGGIRPTVGSDPGMVVFGAEQFAEFFPWGEGSTPHQFKPYAAVGFEEYGRGTLQFTSNVQLGYAVGNHFRSEKHESLRVVLGYYNGNDPRLKYYQFKYNRLGFSYGGVEFDI